ncbi:DEAD/DEAH box helicase [Bacillus amyloliquefaciens]|uniref:DEAD/DEAH box helicase n=1 Tax=Bacillus amyloliquefaciens TaxID=1390 RepID=UPI003C74B6C9
MKPENRSLQLLGVTRSKAKMHEYRVPEDYHIKVSRDPARLFTLSIGMLGDLAVQIIEGIVDENELTQQREYLLFSAHFFDSYLQSRLNEDLDSYLLLLGSASYYLSDLPGSSLVLATQLGARCPNLGGAGLETLLLCLLQTDFSRDTGEIVGPYSWYVYEIIRLINEYFKEGEGETELLNCAFRLRKIVYANGTPRQLLFADIVCAVIKKRLANSVWYCLPQYTGISKDKWQSILQKRMFVREFWPAQHLLGKQGIFQGKSGVVQMPTSAGKTKATEFIIRSAFLSNRTSLAVIIAPFRALCHEIKNSLTEAFHNESVNIDELSDVLQTDLEVDVILGRRQILIVTPEKLLYVLRHSPDLARGIGLLIYDEGHQFDSGSRGITYELLLTSLRSMIPGTVQSVLISAVISNAGSVGNWLNGEENEVVSGTNLIPTFRTVAFASWVDQLGRLEFVDQSNPEIGEFFVPRIIEQTRLQLKGRERKERFFPDKNDGQSIALYFGIKLVLNGSIAIFCGTKSSVTGLCEKVVDAFNRGLSFAKPIECSDQEEIERLHFLYQCNLGTDAIATKTANLGILTHHGNTPHGIRLSVEHAMKEGMARFVICTSTLAQGVNLPIRYLIVTSLYQGSERIKVRDFHNLIGRTGRSGMHTEGSIIFADPNIYDQRRGFRTNWRWGQVKELLDPTNSEPCASTLFQIFEPLHSDNQEYTITTEIIDFIQDFLEDPQKVTAQLENIASEHEDKGFTKKGLENQMFWKMHIISSIESYLMAHGDDSVLGDDQIAELAKGTLAYFLAGDEKKIKVIELFKLLGRNISKNVPNESRRKAFGKTLYGVRTSMEIEAWLSNNIGLIVKSKDRDKLFSVLWPIISKNINNGTFKKCDRPDVLMEITLAWIKGQPFQDLFELISTSGAMLISGSQRRQFNIDHVIDIFENALAYEGTLVLGAIIELIEFINPESEGDKEIIDDLKGLQKSLKYGLTSSSEILLYELGFADRVVSQDISSVVDENIFLKKALIEEIKQKKGIIRKLLKKYPSYFIMILDKIVTE